MCEGEDEGYLESNDDDVAGNDSCQLGMKNFMVDYSDVWVGCWADWGISISIKGTTLATNWYWTSMF